MTTHQLTPVAPLPQPSWVTSVVEQQLRIEFPTYLMMKALATVNSETRHQYNQLQAQRETRHKTLLAMSMPEFDAMRNQQAKQAATQKSQTEQLARDRKDRAIAQAAAKEAAKFYNQPKANADFAHWGTPGRLCVLSRR